MWKRCAYYELVGQLLGKKPVGLSPMHAQLVASFLFFSSFKECCLTGAPVLVNLLWTFRTDVWSETRVLMTKSQSVWERKKDAMEAWLGHQHLKWKIFISAVCAQSTDGRTMKQSFSYAPRQSHNLFWKQKKNVLYFCTQPLLMCSSWGHNQQLQKLNKMVRWKVSEISKHCVRCLCLDFYRQLLNSFSVKHISLFLLLSYFFHGRRLFLTMFSDGRSTSYR